MLMLMPFICLVSRMLSGSANVRELLTGAGVGVAGAQHQSEPGGGGRDSDQQRGPMD